MNRTLATPTTSADHAPHTGGPATGPSLPRLLRGAPDLAEHRRTYGRPTDVGPELVRLAADAGLRGRGGAGFPTARKLDAVRRASGSKVVVANGTEGEPLSGKDKTLLVRNPHLVLDGLVHAADAVGARRRLLCVEAGNPAVERSVTAACSQRPEDGIEIVRTPRRYVTGQETALVDLIDGGAGRPTSWLPFERGVGGRPTLVDNVETLAHLALVARYGPAWYRRIGTADEPGSLLVTLAGSVTRPGVYEVAHGQRLAELLAHAGAAHHRAVLVGGYFGRWLGATDAAGAALSRASLGPLGADLGCGVLVPVADDVCAVDEIGRVATWFAANSARQCGTCTWGLADLATATSGLGSGSDPTGPDTIRRWTAMVRGRGGCKLPDGAAGFLDSALDAFADEIDDHRRGACRRRRAALLPTPSPEAW